MVVLYNNIPVFLNRIVVFVTKKHSALPQLSYFFANYMQYWY